MTINHSCCPETQDKTVVSKINLDETNVGYARGDGLDGGSGCNENQRSGSDGLRGGHGVQWNGRGSGYWWLAAGRKWRLVTLETTPGGENTNRKIKAWWLGIH
jgi:hypothetical protein